MKESILKNSSGNTIIKLGNKYRIINSIDAIINTSTSLYEPDSDFFDEPIKTSYSKGDTIAILDNAGDSTSGDFTYEVSAEVKFLKDTIVFSDGESGEEISTVCIPVGDDKFVNVCGEYFIMDGDDLAKINSDLNKNYKIIFASPC